MRVTFDSNAWERIVVPHRYPKDPVHSDLLKVNAALQDGRVEGFISETVATLEAIPRTERGAYFASRQLKLEASELPRDNGRIGFSIRIGGDDEYHPGLKPVLSDRLRIARELGFKLLPSSRLGIPRPQEIDQEEFRIPLTDWQRENIWDHLQRIDDVSNSIEARGVGRSILERIAERIQKRLGIRDPELWCEGLDRPVDAREANEIMDGFSEWADGDSIALHIGYGLDLFCTGDQGKGAGVSILDQTNRTWLSQTYGVQFVSIPELAVRL
jgi:hypothetical protein